MCIIIISGGGLRYVHCFMGRLDCPYWQYDSLRQSICSCAEKGLNGWDMGMFLNTLCEHFGYFKYEEDQLLNPAWGQPSIRPGHIPGFFFLFLQFHYEDLLQVKTQTDPMCERFIFLCGIFLLSNTSCSCHPVATAPVLGCRKLLQSWMLVNWCVIKLNISRLGLIYWAVFTESLHQPDS